MQKLRNAIYATYGQKPARDLMRAGRRISWHPLVAMFKQDTGQEIATAHMVFTKGHVYPDSHDKMRVKLATDVFHPSTAAAIQTSLKQKPPTTAATLEYLRACWQLWEVIYAGTEGGTKRELVKSGTLAAYKQRLVTAVKWFSTWRKQCQLVSDCHLLCRTTGCLMFAYLEGCCFAHLGSGNPEGPYYVSKAATRPSRAPPQL